VEQQFDLTGGHPFTFDEIRGVAASAWGYQTSGQNWVGTEAKILFSAAVIKALAHHKRGADAMMLLAVLRSNAGPRKSGLVVSPKAMAAVQIIPGWAHGRYRSARDALVELGLLEVEHRGGSGPGDPGLFAFSNKPP
jgi:hypothetical protein